MLLSNNYVIIWVRNRSFRAEHGVDMVSTDYIDLRGQVVAITLKCKLKSNDEANYSFAPAFA